jgi:site-specific DNA recombinase
MKEIVNYLNNKGIKAVRVKASSKKSIGLNFVSNLLHNRRYIGEYRYDDIVGYIDLENLMLHNVKQDKN